MLICLKKRELITNNSFKTLSFKAERSLYFLLKVEKLKGFAMNKFVFVGRVSFNPILKQYDKITVAKFWLIRNEYAGKDQNGEVKFKKVSIPFTAFSSIAKQIADHVMVGDQLIVEAQIANNNYKDKDGNERNDYSFHVREIEFGSPGKKKREKLESRDVHDVHTVEKEVVYSDENISVTNDRILNYSNDERSRNISRDSVPFY